MKKFNLWNKEDYGKHKIRKLNEIGFLINLINLRINITRKYLDLNSKITIQKIKWNQQRIKERIYKFIFKSFIRKQYF